MIIYDPETCRFISADAYLVAGDHINSTNMFAYCLNNPVMFVDPRGNVYEVSTENEALKVFYKLGGTALLLFSGVPFNERLYLLSNCYNLGDYFYVSLVIFQGKKESGCDFDVCRSFRDKKICSIVAKYYTWVDGAGSKERVAKEIYAHTFLYYATVDEAKLLKYAVMYNPENYMAPNEVIGFLYNHSDPISIGQEEGKERKIRSLVYETIWRMNLNGLYH